MTRGAGGGVGAAQHPGELYCAGVHCHGPEPADLDAREDAGVVQGMPGHSARRKPKTLRRWAVFLAGAGGITFTGQVIAVDGGYTTTAGVAVRAGVEAMRKEGCTFAAHPSAR